MGLIQPEDVKRLKVVERREGYTRYDEIIGKVNAKTVYKGFDEITRREIAWSKIVSTDGKLFVDNTSLMTEPWLLFSLNHENIIKGYDFWVDDHYNNKTKTINMITELYTSGSLEDYLKKHDNIDIEVNKDFARQILKGLHYIQSHKPPIMHRALNWSRIYVNGNTGRVMIGDFGYALSHPLDYNEFVVIYSFGMCFFRMVNKKKMSTDLQVRNCIEKCLNPATHRLAAIDLLNDPLFVGSKTMGLRMSTITREPQFLIFVSHMTLL